MPSATATNATKSAPFVSVITPFYNTEEYLAECIESVLAQTYRNWEYILVNNQSTDRSRHIAESYARKEGRVRLVDTPRHYSQIENFNSAFSYISPESRYCKLVLADDWIFPECLDRMVELAEASPSVGIVSSYRLYGNEITGAGLPPSASVVSGREAGRMMLAECRYLTGSPTSVLLRSDLVRATQSFYPLDWIHDDTEACFRILAEHDLGFIHQVLTFSRSDNESLSLEAMRFGPGPLRRFMFAKQYGPRFFSPNDYREYFRREKDFYGQFLAESLFELKDREFWDFQRRGLAAVGCRFEEIGLARYIALELLDILFNPKKTAGRAVRLFKERRKRPQAKDTFTAATVVNEISKSSEG